MQLISLRRPIQAAALNSCRPQAASAPTSSLADRFALLRLDVGYSSTGISGRRWAAVKSQGAYKLKNKKTIPKKLGAKRTGDQYVIPGNILYKQRGTIWHAGENTILGRDHTIHASVAGYVKYYRDPARHPTRQYIGVVFNKEDKLPYPPNAPRVRRLAMVAVQRKTEQAPTPTLSASGIPLKVVRKAVLPEPVAAKAPEPTAAANTPASATPAEVKAVKRTQRQTAKKRKQELAALRLAQRKMQKETRVLHLQSDYSYREHNWEIGRLVGGVGRVQGAAKTQSRHARLRLRRRKKQIVFGTRKAEQRRRRERRLEVIQRAREKKEQRAREEAKGVGKGKKEGKGEKTVA
ncbi:ribosomal L27 protein-domain-containing protein [Coniochaeta sp. 2T2.1]|nr:ribosomal L27 protein-domain-containing protein [Coniochaeta sp. 2T2.1]